MGKILILIAYLVYAVFCVRLISHVLIWYKTAKEVGIYPACISRTPFSIFVIGAADVFFFRRLFDTNKTLWLGSWTFHVCFILVVLRHLRFFMNPVPDCIRYIQPFGLVAGYILPISLVYILLLRMTGGKDKYVSTYNYFLLGVVLLISVTGLLMRTVFRVDVAAVKEFILGILALKPDALPDGFLFAAHFLFVLIMVTYLPFHIFTAPVVAIEARRREEGLRMMLHEK